MTPLIGSVLALVVVGLAVLAVRASRARRRRLERAFAQAQDDDSASPLAALVQGSLDLIGGAVSLLVAGNDRGDGLVTVLFADVAASTKLNVRLGDERWAEVLTQLHRVSKGVVTGHRGRIVKTQGDGFMAVFRTAADGVEAAVGLREALRNHPDVGTPLPLRIGLHTGEVVDRGGDYFGTEVVKAARIADQAKADQILVSAQTRERAPAATGVSYGQSRQSRLKGLPGRHEVTEVGLA